MVPSDTLLKKIGDKIRVLRTEKGYSQEDLAIELNI
jgi:transcriptional regulator with XRE-family HTH domain